MSMFVLSSPILLILTRAMMKLLANVVFLGFRLNINGFHQSVPIVRFLVTQILGAQNNLNLIIIRLMIARVQRRERDSLECKVRKVRLTIRVRYSSLHLRQRPLIMPQ